MAPGPQPPPIFRHSPWWAVATALFWSSAVVIVVGAWAAAASKTSVATFLIIASALGVVGIIYVLLLRWRGQQLSGRPVGTLALIANAATLAFALAVAIFLDWCGRWRPCRRRLLGFPGYPLGRRLHGVKAQMKAAAVTLAIRRPSSEANIAPAARNATASHDRSVQPLGWHRSPCSATVTTTTATVAIQRMAAAIACGKVMALS